MGHPETPLSLHLKNCQNSTQAAHNKAVTQHLHRSYTAHVTAATQLPPQQPPPAAQPSHEARGGLVQEDQLRLHDKLDSNTGAPELMSLRCLGPRAASISRLVKQSATPTSGSSNYEGEAQQQLCTSDGDRQELADITPKAPTETQATLNPKP